MKLGNTGSLVSFVWRHSRREQVLLLLLTVASFPVVYLSLEVPKIIVNEAITGTEFPKSVLGVELDQIAFLLALSFAFLFLVVVHNGMKWLINVGLGMTGERLLRRLRFDLTERVARFPMPRLRSVRQGETIQSIMGEIEPLGGFFGEVLVTPLFQGGLLAVYVGFIFVQDIWLGLAAIAFYPVQTVIVPILQARIVRLNRQRAATARTVAERIGDVIRLSPDMRSNATAPWHLSEIGRLLTRNTEIRQQIFRRKFTIKFLNNFLNQLTPFLFYSIGGYLVIAGSLDFGALVAVLAAYKDLAGPWKAILNYWQRLSDFSGRYIFVLDGFQSDALLPPPEAPSADSPRLEGPLVLAGIARDPASELPGIARLEIAPGETVLLRGGTPSGRESLLRLAAGIDPPVSGSVDIGQASLAGSPASRIAATLGYVPASPGLIQGTLRANLLYGLLRPRDPSAPDQPDGDGSDLGDGFRGEIDLATAGVDGTEALDARLVELVQRFGLARQLQSIALGRALPETEAARWTGALETLRQDMGREAGALLDVIEPWEPERYNSNGSVLANLLFGLPAASAPTPAHHLETPEVQALLRAGGAEALLLDIGWRIAGSLSEIAAAMTETSSLLDRLSGFSRNDVLDAAEIVASAGAGGLGRLRRGDRGRLRQLAANFVRTRDQLDVLDAGTEARVLEIRATLIERVRRSEGIVPFDAGRYQPGQTIADNILPGRRRFDRKASWDRIDRSLETLIAERNLESVFLRIGLDAPTRDVALPAAILRRIGLIRALLKRPRFLLVEGAADLHPDGEAGLLAELRRLLPEAGLLIATDASDERPDGVDRVMTIDANGALSAGP